MSRIHEALKKAEEGRAPIGAAGIAWTRDSIAPGAVPSDGAARWAWKNFLPRRVEGASPAPDHLRLEELRKRCAQPTWKLDPEKIVFCNSNWTGLGAEQFRTLRSRLYRLRENRPLRTLLITSSLPEEGKTFVAMNLAQAIVRQHERRTLLIDADLRCPRLHLPLHTSSAPGLTDYLRGEADEFSIIQCGSQDNLFFIPAGGPVSNPAELLADVRLKSLLDRMAPVFDWIILDSPPTLLISDAAVLAGLSDGVLLVVRAGFTPADSAQKSCREFRDKNLIGIILNRAEEGMAYGAYSYYAGNGKDKR